MTSFKVAVSCLNTGFKRDTEPGAQVMDTDNVSGVGNAFRRFNRRVGYLQKHVPCARHQPKQTKP